MPEPLLFFILLSALAIGWLLGRFGRRPSAKEPKASVTNSQYVTGLNFLLNDQPDGAIDAFIASLAVNSETIETHLAIGSLARRRGEMSRAIRVHQNLLARPSLSRSHRQKVQYELAMDYMQAGWLDRAERILSELLDQALDDRPAVLKSLILLYEQEQEWKRALPLARQLIGLQAPREKSVTQTAAAHYVCEIAESAIAESRFNDAIKSLRNAAQLDSDNVRSAILKARAYLGLGQNKRALSALKKIADREPSALVEAIPELKQVFAELGNEQGLLNLLEANLSADCSTAYHLAVYDEMLQRRGGEDANQFLREQLKNEKSLPAVARLLEHEAEQSDGPNAEVLERLNEAVKISLQQQPRFRCQQCGFSGQRQHWQCPSCKTWNAVERL